MQSLIIIFLTLFLFATPTEAKQYCKLAVELTGLSPEVEPWVMVGLSAKIAEQEKKLNEDRIESLHQIAPSEIRNTLEALGFYHAKIQSKLTFNDYDYVAHYHIEMGRPTLIKNVKIRVEGFGASFPELNALIESPPFIRGHILEHRQYEAYKQRLLSKALQLGFLEAVFLKNEVQIDQDSYCANIILILDTGPRYKFGEINFQETPYPISYLIRYIPFQFGAPYTIQDIHTLQKNLTESDLFRYVRIDPILSQTKDYHVPLNVRLKPKPRDRYTGSLGYGTDTGARGMLWWEHRRHNYPGHRINAEVQVAKWKKYTNIRYTIPGEKPTTDRSVFAFRTFEERYRDNKYSLRGDLSMVQIKKIGCFERLMGLHYLIKERYRELPGYPKKEAHYLIPSFGLAYKDLKKKKPEEEGIRLSFSTRGAAKSLISTTSFLQGEFRAKWINALSSRTRLLLRFELGATATKHQDKISLSLRYFTGGDQSVRGYGYKSLGPRKVDAYKNEIVVGGQYLAVGSVELEQKIYKKFSGAVFYDVGQAMNTWRVRFARGVGVGIRYHTPLGPFRIDVAQALVPITAKKSSPRIHLSFGMDL